MINLIQGSTRDKNRNRDFRVSRRRPGLGIGLFLRMRNILSSLVLACFKEGRHEISENKSPNRKTGKFKAALWNQGRL